MSLHKKTLHFPLSKYQIPDQTCPTNVFYHIQEYSNTHHITAARSSYSHHRPAPVLETIAPQNRKSGNSGLLPKLSSACSFQMHSMKTELSVNVDLMIKERKLQSYPVKIGHVACPGAAQVCKHGERRGTGAVTIESVKLRELVPICPICCP